MGDVKRQISADGIKRRDFLGAAAGATALGGLAADEAAGQQPNTTTGAASAPGDAGQLYKRHAPKLRQHDRPLPDLTQFDGMKAQKAEGALPSAYHEKEIRRIKELGLEPVDSIQDKTEFSCFQRGSLPHWSGINTFLKLSYLEDVRKVGEYDVAFVGVPFDIGCTFRTGTRFGPQGIRRISALYEKYSYEHGIDLSETLAMCDVGDIFCPANITKSHDQITKGVAHILSQGTMPMIMGGDHSIGYPCAAAWPSAWRARWGSFTWTGTWTHRKRIWMRSCTPARGSTPPTSRTARRRTWCSWESGAGRCPVRV